MLEKLVIEEGTKDSAARVPAAVAADEDCRLCDGLWGRKGRWRVERRVRQEGLIAEIGGGEVVLVGRGIVDPREV